MANAELMTVSGCRERTGFLRNGRYEYILAWFIPLLVLITVFSVRGIYPFGHTSVLVWDMEIQYLGYFGWLCNVLHGDGSLVYSFSQGFGTGTIALLSYYLSSPCNLLLLFFTPSTIPQFFSWLTLLKIPLAGLTCYAFLRKRFNPGSMQVILASGYALCGYVVCECSNIMWLDGVIMLPLVALGTYHAVKYGKHLLLYLSVAAAIVFNWYTGYMVCLFSLLYFAFCQYDERHADGGDGKRGSAESVRAHELAVATARPPRKLTGRPLLGSCVRYLVTMTLGVGTSMFLFLPAILGLQQGKGGTLSFADFFQLHRMSNPSNFFDYLCITSAPATSESVRPAVYITAVVLVLVLVFFLNRGVGRKRRIAYGILLATVVLSFFVVPLEIIWSAFKKSYSYYYRNAFVFDFLLVLLAAEGYHHLFSMEAGYRRRCLVSATAIVIVLLGLAVMNIGLYESDVEPSAGAVVLEIGLLVIFAVLLGVLARFRDKGPDGRWDDTSRLLRSKRIGYLILGGVALIFIAEQCVNTYSVFGHYGTDVNYYGKYLDKMEAVYSELEGDGSPLCVGQTRFSYMSSDPDYTTAETYVMDTQGFGVYSSTMDVSSAELFWELGYAQDDETYGTYYNSPNFVSDSLLSVDYIIARTPPVDATEVEVSELPYEGYHVYRNEGAYPFGYGIRSDAGEVDWTDSPFDNRMAVLKDMLGSDVSDIYHRDQVGDAPGQTSGSATRFFDVMIDKTGPAYVYTPVTNRSHIECKVYVDGSEVQSVGGRFDDNLMYIGTRNEGDTVRVELRPNRPYHVGTSGETVAERIWKRSPGSLLQVKTLDMNRLGILRSEQEVGEYATESYSDGSLSADYTAPSDQTLLMMIPYDTGWKITVDGRRVDARRCYSSLTGIPVTAGSHHIQMVYEPAGLHAGIAISMVSIIAFLGWRLISRRREYRMR